MMLSAKMWIYEHRGWLCAPLNMAKCAREVCVFPGSLCLPVFQFDEGNPNMKVNKVFVLFIFAACCFLAGTVNHIVNTGEGWVSSLLLAAGCLCGAFVFGIKR